jgi:hypothetical protein
VCSSETSATIMPGRNCRRMDNHRYGLRGKIINNPTDGSSRLARWANRLPAFTDLGTTDFFRIINGGTGNSDAQISGITVTSLAAVPGPIALDCRVCSLPAAACLPWRGVGARPQSWLLPRFSGAPFWAAAVINLCSAERGALRI